MALPKCEWRIRFATAPTITISETSPSVTREVTVAAVSTDYYWTTATALLTTIGTNLTNDATLAGTYALTLADDADNATGKVTITKTGGGGNFSIDAGTQSILSYLGLTGSYSGGTSYTGAAQARFLWLPNVKRVNPMSPEPSSTANVMGAQVQDGTFTVAPSGDSQVIAYNRRRIDNLEHQYLLGNKVWIALESTTNESLEKCYQDAIYSGAPLRFHPDRSSDTNFHTMRINPTEMGFQPRPMFPGWVSGASSLWAIQWPMIGYV